MKGDDARGVESIGPAPGPPPLVVEGEQRGQDLSAALLALHLLEADRRVPLKVPEPPAEVVAMLAAQRPQIGVEGVSGQGDERADVGWHL